MSPDQARGVILAVLDAVIVVHARAFDEALEAAAVAEDRRDALRDTCQVELLLWYREHLERLEAFVLDLDQPDTIH